MAWQGFLKESKSYMNYPHCGRFHFWRRFPAAVVKYYAATWELRSVVRRWRSHEPEME